MHANVVEVVVAPVVAVKRRKYIPMVSGYQATTDLARTPKIYLPVVRAKSTVNTRPFDAGEPEVGIRTQSRPVDEAKNDRSIYAKETPAPKVPTLYPKKHS